MRTWMGWLTFGVMAATVACGGEATFTPTAPSPIGSGGSPAIEGAVIEGQVRMATAAPLAAAESGGTLTVEVVGTNLQTTVSVTGQFTLTGVPAGDVTLHFKGPGIDARVTLTGVQSGQTITISVAVSGTQAAIQQEMRHGGPEKIELEGRIESLPPTQPAGTLIVAGRTVRTDGSTLIRQGDTVKTFADLLIGMRVHVKGRLDGTAIVASEIRIQNTETRVPVQLNGIVENLTGTEVAFQFTVAGRLVKGDGDTEFGGSGKTVSFGDLRNGVRVEIKGEQRDGFVYAVRIHVHRDGVNDEEKPKVELTGTVANLSGACPTLSFSVNGQTVVTDNRTEFKKTPCSGLKNGDRVEVEGVRQADGRILARKVEVEVEEVELRGTVSGLSGACPTLSFSVNGQTVVTDNRTEFKKTPCSSLKNGDRVEVEGVRQADGRVLARKVEVEVEEVELQGTVSGLSGTCPTLSFTVNGQAVVTDSRTEFKKTPCSSLKNGDRVEVEGVRQADGRILARKVEVER